MRKSWAALAILGLATFPAGGAVYKWLDASGVTQYSEFAPSGVEAREVYIAPSPGEPVASEDAAAPEPTAEDKGPITDEDLHARYARSRAVQCAQVRETIRVLQIKGPVWRVNDAGEEVLLTNEERAAEMETALKREPKYCPTPAS